MLYSESKVYVAIAIGMTDTGTSFGNEVSFAGHLSSGQHDSVSEVVLSALRSLKGYKLSFGEHRRATIGAVEPNAH